MGFEPGNKLAGSRKGIPNRRTQELAEILKASDFCPIRSLVFAANEARKLYEVSGGTGDEAVLYLKLLADASKDLATFIYPKLKSIEQVSASPLDDMTPEQKLEAMRAAVKMLESQVAQSE